MCHAGSYQSFIVYFHIFAGRTFITRASLESDMITRNIYPASCALIILLFKSHPDSVVRTPDILLLMGIIRWDGSSSKSCSQVLGGSDSFQYP